MPRSAKSASLPRPSKPKYSAAGRRLVAGFSEALAHARGEMELPTYTVTVPDRVDVAKLRHRLGLSQSAFARAFGLDVTAIHAWEQGRRRPDRTARILLAVIASEPAAVRRALAGPPAG
jgi:putative transcriptional regulator